MRQIVTSQYIQFGRACFQAHFQKQADNKRCTSLFNFTLDGLAGILEAQLFSHKQLKCCFLLHVFVVSVYIAVKLCSIILNCLSSISQTDKHLVNGILNMLVYIILRKQFYDQLSLLFFFYRITGHRLKIIPISYAV